MQNETQIARYKKLIRHLDTEFKEEIDIEKVEEICHYSYRNINRIFLALHQETIGKYVKRIRLEKAAQYLKYSDRNVSDIAFEIGYNDVAAFSKAFKKKFQCSPSAFKESNIAMLETAQTEILSRLDSLPAELSFVIEYIPKIECIYLEYRGSYEDFEAIRKTWEKLYAYAQDKQLVHEDSIFFAEVLDDNEISEKIHCRYNVALMLEKPLSFIPEELFNLKTLPYQKYAKFLHKGPHETCMKTYDKIYAYWMTNVKLEFADLPSLEFFLNDEENTAPEDLLTEIYIPVL